MMDALRNAFWTTLFLGLLSVPVGLALGYFDMQDFKQSAVGLGRELGGHTCDGNLALAEAKSAIAKVSSFSPDHNSQEEFDDQHVLIVENLNDSAKCGNVEARVLKVNFICKGAFGYKKSYVVARQLIAQYDKDGGYHPHNSPYKGVCESF